MSFEPEPGAMTAVETEGLTKSFGDLTALDGLSLTVERGELFGLLGPNGAGKSTAIKILTGQLLPDEGQARVLGTDPTADPIGTRQQVGILPEREEPPSFMTPREYFSFVGSVRGLDEQIVEERVQSWADRLSLSETFDTLVTDLSRGQQQKVMITAAFLAESDLVFIDEPLANLDPIIQERVRQFLTTYVEAGKTVFLSTHQIEVAEAICTRVGIINEGEMTADREPSSLDPDESLLDLFLSNVELMDLDGDIDANA